MDKGLIFYYLTGIVLVLGISFISHFLFARYNLKLSTWVLYLFLIGSVYMLLVQLLKYRSLHFYVDFSHWAQLLYSIATTGKPWSLNVELLVPGTLNYLSVHFAPLIYVVAIPFKIWPYGETLIILNFLLMISAAIPMYKLALTCQGDKRFALFVAVLFLWYPTFQYLVLYEFGILRFSIPIILWMLYFWEKRNMVYYYLFVLLAVLVREEVGLTIMMFGIYLLIVEKQRRAGLITAFIGIMAFTIITQTVMPSLRGGEGYHHIAIGSFSTFGNSFGEIIINTIKNPLLVLKTILQPIKLANVFMLFLPLLFIPLLAPAVLIAILANLGVGLISRSHLHISYMLFYLSPSIPFIFYAFIKGWPKFLTILERLNKLKLRVQERTDIASVSMGVVLTGIIAANVFFGPSPIALQFWFKDLRPAPFGTRNFHYSAHKITTHHKTATEFINHIPDSAIVSAPHFLHPPLFKKKGSIIFPRHENSSRNLRADYVLLDKTNNSHTEKSTVFRIQRDFDPVENDKQNWKLIKSKDGYFLYKRIKNI